MTISKILIANRGEIACRIIRTANRVGIKCVSVFSDADTNSLHVKLADEAIYIGKPPPQQSYLVKEKLINAAKATKCQAVCIHIKQQQKIIYNNGREKIE